MADITQRGKQTGIWTSGRTEKAFYANSYALFIYTELCYKLAVILLFIIEARSYKAI